MLGHTYGRDVGRGGGVTDRGDGIVYLNASSPVISISTDAMLPVPRG